MCFFFSFLPATFWVVIGYCVLFSSTRVEGKIKKFGQILALWMFFVALCFIICGAYSTIAGLCPMDAIFEKITK